MVERSAVANTIMSLMSGMNIDDSPATPGRYGVRAIPTVLAIKGGEVVQQIQGARPKADFTEMVQKLV